MASSTATGSADRVARNGASLLTARVVAAVASMVSLPFLYSSLGAHRFGVWVLLTGAVAILNLLDLGLGSAQIREVAQASGDGCPHRAAAVLGLGTIWGIGSGTLLAGGTIVCWPWLSRAFHLDGSAGQIRDAALLLLVGFTLDGLGRPWQAVLEGTQRYGSVARITGGTAVLGAGLGVFIAARGGGLVALGAGSAAISALRTLVLVSAARRRVPGVGPQLRGIRASDVAAVTGYGIPVQVSNAAAAVNAETDRLVIAGFFSPSAVAAFDVGSRLANLLRLPAAAMFTILFPAAATAACEASPDRLDRMYIVTTRYLAVYVAAGTAALAVSAEPLVRLFLGHPVPLGATTLVIVALGCAVNLTSGAAAVVTRAEGRPGRETCYALLAAGLNILMTIPLIGLLGPVGAPVSTALAATAATVYFFVHFHRDSGRPFVPLLQALWPPAAAAVTAAGLTWAVAPALPDGAGRLGAALAVVSRTGTSLVIVIGALVALGFFTRADRDRLRTVLARLARHRNVEAATNRRTW
ncbi:lipopolysaccharide biosynthesis protein [Streptomyces sp. 8N616]|uniref:lipopolysaccharide biosynthesis protein n=1 Tax=Streptomyces sp. 8N616 TaxID=3457414 RepID=UPI003FD52B3A